LWMLREKVSESEKYDPYSSAEWRARHRIGHGKIVS
jgi:hypothetical protein